MRKLIQPKIRDFRVHVERLAEGASGMEAAQLAVLGDYAAGVQGALNLDGKAPFDYAGLATDEALTDVQRSLNELEKRGER